MDPVAAKYIGAGLAAIGMGAAGAIMGMVVTERLIVPTRAGARSGAPGAGSSSQARSARLSLYPENLALLLTHTRGESRVPLGTFRF